MPKPQTKNDLLDQSQLNYDNLISLIQFYSPKMQLTNFHPGTLNRNIRDVIAHIHHWHLMLLDWYSIGQQGLKPNMPAAGYTWQTLPALNLVIWKKYQTTSLEIALDLLADSFAQVQALIKRHSEDELFEKKRYNWTGSTSLAAYIISDTVSHYTWGLKIIRKGLK